MPMVHDEYFQYQNNPTGSDVENPGLKYQDLETLKAALHTRGISLPHAVEEKIRAALDRGQTIEKFMDLINEMDVGEIETSKSIPVQEQIDLDGVLVNKAKNDVEIKTKDEDKNADDDARRSIEGGHMNWRLPS